ncbi:MAG TPA: FecR family protein [Planctomycetota bacterium]|nr:FecR family protein [Planctomycetota bacterium]
MESVERCEAYLEGELAPEGEAEFRAWLRADAAHVREFVRYAHLHRALRAEFKGRRVRREESLLARGSEQELRSTKARRRVWIKWAAAAALLIGGFCVYKFLLPDPALAFYSARVVAVSGPVFKTLDQAGVTRSLAKKDDLMAAKTSLEFDGPGQATLKYMDGTTLDFTVNAGPSALRLVRAADKPEMNHSRIGKRVSIESGVLNASVASQSEVEPMILSTPVAELTVVGTRFRVEATLNSTRLDVSEGRVRIVRYLDAAAVEVGAGEFVVVDEKNALKVQCAQ